MKYFNDNCRPESVDRRVWWSLPCLHLWVSWALGPFSQRWVSVLFGRRGTAPQNELVSLAGCSALIKFQTEETRESQSQLWAPGLWLARVPQEELGASPHRTAPSRWTGLQPFKTFYMMPLILSPCLLSEIHTSPVFPNCQRSPQGLTRSSLPLGHRNLQALCEAVMAQKHSFLVLGIRQWDGFHTNVQWQKDHDEILNSRVPFAFWLFYPQFALSKNFRYPIRTYYIARGTLLSILQ